MPCAGVTSGQLTHREWLHARVWVGIGKRHRNSNPTDSSTARNVVLCRLIGNLPANMLSRKAELLLASVGAFFCCEQVRSCCTNLLPYELQLRLKHFIDRATTELTSIQNECTLAGHSIKSGQLPRSSFLLASFRLSRKSSVCRAYALAVRFRTAASRFAQLYLIYRRHAPMLSLF